MISRALIPLLLAAPFLAAAETNTAELVRLAYGAALTPEEKDAKRTAAAALNKRGVEKARALMEHVHVPNMYIRFDLDTLVRRNKDTVAPILLDFLDSENDRTRSYAAYYLGFTPATNETQRLLPLLDDKDTATTAIRTLGKWKATNQIERIQGFLRSENERRRITAANALRDIGDPAAIPAILPLLDDPLMTVRYVAERALTSFDQTAPLIEALDFASPVAKRHLIHCLGDLQAEPALIYLEAFAKTDDPGLRADALEAIDKIRAEPAAPTSPSR